MWPEGDVFGPADVEPEDELELLKQILHATLPRESPERQGSLLSHHGLYIDTTVCWFQSQL